MTFLAHALLLEPSRPLPDLPVMLPGEIALSEDGCVRGSHRRTVVASDHALGTGELVRVLPHEFYLRQLMDLDLQSDDALLELMRQYGLLAADRPLDWLHGSGTTPQTTMQDARERAAVLRDTTRTLLANAGLIEVDELMARWESRGGSRSLSVIFQIDPLGVAIRLAATTLTTALGVFGPRVQAASLSKQEVFGIPLESAICAQMFNHLAESATYRRCAVKSCSQPFVRQLGGAKKGQHKLEGVMYCSRSCAQAAASKRYRDEKKAERLASGNEGESNEGHTPQEVR